MEKTRFPSHESACRPASPADAPHTDPALEHHVPDHDMIQSDVDAAWHELAPPAPVVSPLLRYLIDAVDDIIFIKDISGVYQMCNKAGEKFIGLPECEQIGKTDFDFFDREIAEGILELDRQVLASGKTRRIEEWVPCRNGEKILLDTMKTPFFGPDGKLSGVVGIARDITDIRQVRLDVLKTQKLESLGVLAGGIAHNFNNILTAILGNISLARLQAHDPVKVEKRLIDAENATVRARELTQQLLTFARGGEPVKKVIKIPELLFEAANLALLGSKVRCEFALAEDVWSLEADEGQLVQVIHNLVLNAVQAMPEGGTITISAENVTARQSGRRFVQISVADNGAGIPEQNLLRIFDPYFTTKPQGVVWD